MSTLVTHTCTTLGPELPVPAREVARAEPGVRVGSAAVRALERTPAPARAAALLPAAVVAVTVGVPEARERVFCAVVPARPLAREPDEVGYGRVAALRPA